MKLVLPLPPSANRYWRSVNGRVLVSKEARAYREHCALVALAQGATVLEGGVMLSARVFFVDRRRDLDGALKVLLDALEGVCYRNDRQIEFLAFRHAIDKANPRVEIEVSEADP